MSSFAAQGFFSVKSIGCFLREKWLPSISLHDAGQ